ncbi:MAG: tetratricopeptide repeat protein, partial [Anaerolineales bacterium]|nr:tetratricopeptide repeat protein [Anaerolineales bacterium]
MPTNLPKTTVKFLIALLKHQAENLLGKDAAGILGDDVQEKIDDWLKSEKTEKDLLKSAQQAQIYLQDERNCPDKDLRYFFRDIGFGDLPAVQEALAELPQAMDASGVTDALRESFHGFSTLSASQQEEGAKLYTEALLRAVGSLEEFVSPILIQTVLDLKKEQHKTTKDNSIQHSIQIEKLDKILARLEARTVAKRDPSPTLRGDLPLGSYLPIQPNQLFTGREAELKQLADTLLTQDGGAIISQQALVGMGGIGKTQLAVQFAWQEGYRFAGVHWVSAFSRDQSEELTEKVIEASIARCGAEMGLQPWSSETDQQAALTVSAWKQSGPRLVILDNLEDMDAAAEWLARLRHTNIRILITTRQKDWSPSFGLHEISLHVFTLTESLAFLRRALDETRASDADLTALHKRFGGLPLPLDLAASYLQHVDKLSVTNYLERLSLDHASLRNWRAKHPTATQHDKDVAASFALSLERVSDENARRIFLLAGYGLPNEPLLQDVLQAAAELDDAPYSEALDLLRGLSLVQPEPSLHPLLADFARLQDTDRTALFRWSRALAARGYPWYEHGGMYRDPSLARYIRLSLPDILRAVSFSDREAKEFSNLCYHAAFLLAHFGDLDGAMKLYQQAREILEGLGDLKGKSATLHQMAGIYVTRGDLDGAMKLYQQSLELFDGLGDLKGKSATLHQMAGIYVTRGDLDGAMKLYQ